MVMNHVYISIKVMDYIDYTVLKIKQLDKDIVIYMIKPELETSSN